MRRLVLLLSFVACRDHPAPVSAGADRPHGAIRESGVPAEAGPDTLTPGTWFTVATNPNPDFYDKVVTDYLRVTVEPGGRVIRTRQNGRTTETERGTWVPGPGPKEATLTFDLGPQVGRQSWTWRLESGGRAREVHWKNLTTGREYAREQDLYVLEGSPEWERRGKIRLNDEPAPANGWPARPSDGTPERVFVDYLKAWSRHDWSGMAALSSPSWLAQEPDPAWMIEVGDGRTRRWRIDRPGRLHEQPPAF